MLTSNRTQNTSKQTPDTKAKWVFYRSKPKTEIEYKIQVFTFQSMKQEKLIKLHTHKTLKQDAYACAIYIYPPFGSQEKEGKQKKI